MRDKRRIVQVFEDDLPTTKVAGGGTKKAKADKGTIESSSKRVPLKALSQSDINKGRQTRTSRSATPVKEREADELKKSKNVSVLEFMINENEAVKSTGKAKAPKIRIADMAALPTAAAAESDESQNSDPYAFNYMSESGPAAVDSFSSPRGLLVRTYSKNSGAPLRRYKPNAFDAIHRGISSTKKKSPPSSLGALETPKNLLGNRESKTKKPSPLSAQQTPAELRPSSLLELSIPRQVDYYKARMPTKGTKEKKEPTKNRGRQGEAKKKRKNDATIVFKNMPDAVKATKKKKTTKKKPKGK